MPPALFNLSGTWDTYVDQIYNEFQASIIQNPLTFRGKRVSCRRGPETDGKWFGFWHLISEGRIEEERTPDLRRCERIAWVRWVIENAATNPDIDIWENNRGSNTNILLWYNEDYLVVLKKGSTYYMIVTAYCVTYENQKRKLRKERDAFITK